MRMYLTFSYCCSVFLTLPLYFYYFIYSAAAAAAVVAADTDAAVAAAGASDASAGSLGAYFSLARLALLAFCLAILAAFWPFLLNDPFSNSSNFSLNNFRAIPRLSAKDLDCWH